MRMAKQNLEPVRKLKKPDGTTVYMLNNKLHNWEDAAVIHPDGKKEYWLFGFQYTKDQFIDRKRDVNGVPPSKDPKYDTRL
jgi:hypothetical protein